MRSQKGYDKAKAEVLKLEEQLCRIAAEYPELLKDMPQSEAICHAAVSSHGEYLEDVREQTYDVVLAAVRQNGCALKYAKIQSPEICEAAVESIPGAIEYVRKQTPGLCRKAIEKCPTCIGLVRDQTAELCELAVRKNPMAIRYVREQTVPLVWLALKNGVADHFVDPDVLEELRDIEAQSKWPTPEDIEWMKYQDAVYDDIELGEPEYPDPEDCVPA